MMKKIKVILQARMSSSRLPGKVLMAVNGTPLLLRQVERLQQSKTVQDIVVATSSESSDDPIAKLCQRSEISCFRGSLHDVLDRFYQATISHDCDIVVRITGDCPLIDARIVDLAVSEHIKQGNQYTSNSILPDDPDNTFTYADGLDVEVVNTDVLKSVWQTASDNYYREHVTSYIRTHPNEFKIGYLHHKPSIAKFRLTIDQPEDLTLIQRVFEYFDSVKPDFDYLDVVDFLEKHPEISQINNMHNLYLEQNND